MESRETGHAGAFGADRSRDGFEPCYQAKQAPQQAIVQKVDVVMHPAFRSAFVMLLRDFLKKMFRSFLTVALPLIV